MDEIELNFECGHRNYGTVGNPASVQIDCPVCGHFYCHDCNYDRHICGGCGDPYRHGRRPHPGFDCVA